MNKRTKIILSLLAGFLVFSFFYCVLCYRFPNATELRDFHEEATGEVYQSVLVLYSSTTLKEGCNVYYVNVNGRMEQLSSVEMGIRINKQFVHIWDEFDWDKASKDFQKNETKSSG